MQAGPGNELGQYRVDSVGASMTLLTRQAACVLHKTTDPTMDFGHLRLLLVTWHAMKLAGVNDLCTLWAATRWRLAAGPLYSVGRWRLAAGGCYVMACKKLAIKNNFCTPSLQPASISASAQTRTLPRSALHTHILRPAHAPYPAPSTCSPRVQRPTPALHLASPA